MDEQEGDFDVASLMFRMVDGDEIESQGIGPVDDVNREAESYF